MAQNNKKVLGIIPARLKSTRLPGKMLAEINGKPLIYHTWSKAKKAKTLDAVIVATDSSVVKEVAEGFGAEVMMTSSRCKTGSDRVAEAYRKFKKFKPYIVVNIQGDEPMIPPEAIDKTVNILKNDKVAVMSTVASTLIKEEDFDNPGVVKVIKDKNDYAIYFSRFPIPYKRNEFDGHLKHIGIYGFKADFLSKYVKLKQTSLERAESLEQLRVIENGFKIKLGVGPFLRVEVNEKDELEAVRRLMKK